MPVNVPNNRIPIPIRITENTFPSAVKGSTSLTNPNVVVVITLHQTESLNVLISGLILCSSWYRLIDASNIKNIVNITI